MIKGLKISQIKSVAKISKKLHFDKAKLERLVDGRKAGIDDEVLLAELLGIPDGTDAKTFLGERLTDKELDVLRDLIANFTDGKGSNILD